MTPEPDEPVRILLVEDSPSDAALLEATLTEGPGRTDVVNAETLEGAVAAALEQPFDAVLLDLSLPDSCGLETVVRARAAWPQLPIVVLTGAEDEQLGLEAVRSGVQDYLVKGQAGGAVIARSLRYAIERKRSENEILRMNDELERRVGERTAQLRQLALQVTLAEEEQRRRLAEVLHDNLQQLLVYARLTVGEALSLARGARLRASLGRVEQGLAEAIDVSRSLTAELSPPLLYERGLLAALRWLTEQMRERCSLAVEICAGPDDEPRQEVVRVLLFQCIRELLANVVKHAGVKEAFVTIGRSAGVVRVEVADRGWGFNPEGRAAAAVSGGFGLFSIRERLRQSGGSFEMQSAPGRGSRITLVVPDADEPRRPGRRVSDPPAPSSA